LFNRDCAYKRIIKMYIYFEDKELALNALTYCTDKTNILKRYGDRYRLNVYDLTFRERSKFFYRFSKKEYLNSFKIDKEDHSKVIVFLPHDLQFAMSIYNEIQSKYKDREDVVVFINRKDTPDCLQLVFHSNNEDKERKAILKTINEENIMYLKTRLGITDESTEGC
jgi:hypothetical protein